MDVIEIYEPETETWETGPSLLSVLIFRSTCNPSGKPELIGTPSRFDDAEEIDGDPGAIREHAALCVAQ